MKKQGKILLVVFLFASSIWLMDVYGAEQDFPNKPLEFVVPYVAGGSTDVACRTMIARAKKFFNNQPIVVLNKPEGGTVAGSRYVLEKRDGYTLYLVSTSSTMVTPALLKPGYSWRDFSGIAQVQFGGDCIYVRADVPYNTMEKFIEYAKQNPGKIKYATSGVGTLPHLGIAALAAAKGIDIKHIPTKGNPEVIAAILGGDVPVAGGSYPIFKPHVEAGTIKVLGQFCNERDPFLQNVPTLKEQDIDVVIDYWRWVVVSKHTPANQVKVLAAAFKNLLQDKETLANLKKIAVPVSYLPPEEYETMMKKSEVAVSSAIKAAGLEKK